ncbi:snRNA-activating protein of 50kDa MW C terminal-domain-containing protein [Gymnopilus junonius]|uniref:snRNA-activating protein of 50kDa MW C terminal-domain-containing protein n=1 Tax=Gymnopilus junonius TaxID=109634 RepID=A0A9P5NS49_GYMJU|nr:snRNA-activating protein of 50kDa MW C terminal-domain-containing protein [Gymnopilus junonius]
MNAGTTHAIESLFGPSSQKIELSNFIESSSELYLLTHEQETFPDHIIDECSISEIHKLLNDTWSNPTLSAHLIRDHDNTISALHSLHSTPNQKPQKLSRRSHLPDPDKLPVEVTTLQKKLDAVSLNSFRLKADSVHFMRTQKNADKNILQDPIQKSFSTLDAGQPEAVITISIHHRIHWGPSYVTRSSQHAFLSSQTLQDIYDAIPCESKHLPPELGLPEGQTGCVICIEDFAYGDGVGAEDYATKLTKAPTCQRETKLSGLSLRIAEPYWLIHHGNCEHFVVVDQIRLLHPFDPRSGYPLTLQIVPAMLDLCRACTKVPAVLSVVGDVRLAESPCLLCGPCWRSMGASEDKAVIVLPLVEPSYR